MTVPFGALSSMGGMTGGAGGSAGGSAGSNSGFDNSGWNVNFGSGSIDAGMGQYMPYVLAAAAVLIVWRMTRKR